MSNTLYPVSNNFEMLMKGEHIPLINLKQSIKEHLYVLLSTIPNEYLYNRSYGCELLSTDFNIEAKDYEKNTLFKFIQDSVVKFEPRIDPAKFECKIDIDTEEKNFTLRKKMKMQLEIYTKETFEKIIVNIEYYLSPFAVA